MIKDLFTTVQFYTCQFLGYLKVPQQALLDLTLFYLYLLYYPSEKYRYEKAKTALPSTELTYGEISYASLLKALTLSKLCDRSIFVDLGCGKGKALFFVHQLFQCRCVGVDIIPSYSQYASIIIRKHAWEGVKCVHKDLFKAKFSRATHVLISTTCFSKTRLIQAKKKLETLVKGSIIISVSNPIKGNSFIPITSFKGICSWGKTDIYIQKRA